MRCPTIAELPPPPAGRVGWPWTEATDSSPESGFDSQSWPRVTIVTPSYNQGEFLEETIRSVLLQGYPNLEYVVMDGGSSDQSVAIIRRYEKWLTNWVSEKDHGQAAAINKGFSRSTGDICAYLNSDDVYLPNALRSVVGFFDKHPDATLLYGDCQLIDESSRVIDLLPAQDFDPATFVFGCYIPQPAAFWRKSVLANIGQFKEEMHYAFDYELWLRIAGRYRLQHAPLLLAQHRKAEGTKTVSRPEAFAAEVIAALQTFFSARDLPGGLKSLEEDAYAIALFDQALLNVRLERINEGREAMRRVFQYSPNLVTRQRERLIRALVNHADPSQPLDDANAHLEQVFAELAENANSLLVIEPSVRRRVEILNAARSKDRLALRRARRLLLPTVLDDSHWIRNRAARRELFGVLVGEAALRRLAGLRQMLRIA